MIVVFKKIKIAFFIVIVTSLFFIGCVSNKTLIVEPKTFQFKLFDVRDETNKPLYVTLPIEAKELIENATLSADYTPLSQIFGAIRWYGVATPKRTYILFVYNQKLAWVGFAIYNTETDQFLTWIFDTKGIPQPASNDDLNQYLHLIEQKLLKLIKVT